MSATVLLWMVVTFIAITVSILWLRLCLFRPAAAAVIIVGFAVAWSHVLALTYRISGDAVLVRELVPLKDAAAILLLAALLRRELSSSGALRALSVTAILLLLALLPAVALAVGDSDVSRVGLSLRNVLIPFIAGTTGLLLRDGERRTAVRMSVIIIAVAGAYALVEYAMPMSFVRDVIGVGAYWGDVKQQPFLLDPDGGRLPGNFFTSAGTRRLSGSFGDPLAAGYVLATSIVLGVLSRMPRVTWAALAVTVPALLLTFTRAGWIIVVCSLAPAVARRFMSGRRPVRVAMTAGVVVAVAALLLLPTSRTYFTNVFTGRDGSTLGHLAALSSLRDHQYSVFGSGMGAVGAAIGSGTESVFVTIALQAGVLGLILYLAALLTLAVLGARRWRTAGLGREYVGAWLGVVISMIVSEQLLTFNAGWIMCFLIFLSPLDVRKEAVVGLSRDVGVKRTGPCFGVHRDDK